MNNVQYVKSAKPRKCDVCNAIKDEVIGEFFCSGEYERLDYEEDDYILMQWYCIDCIKYMQSINDVERSYKYIELAVNEKDAVNLRYD